ncbi:MAG TPA: regulator [Flavobacteriales bacterium]|nr:regulator [Flavobacteriales bacterium]
MLQTLNRFTGTALVLVLTATTATAQIPCVDGNAGGYPCQNIDLMGYLSSDEVGGGDMNDIWGWIDPSDGTEYAILGRSTGTSFIDISDPANPVMVANLPTNTVTSFWRDIKVHDNHAFIVSEASGHGMQVVDLTQLGGIDNPPEDIEADALYTGWGNAHNIVINESTARAYGVGTATFSGGLHILDISDPLNPTLIGDYAGDGYTHDAQVVSYIGPDGNYQGKEIAFCCNENTVTIVDVTDPTDATMISSVGYAGSSYTHQGWLTEDHRYFMSNDELDEQDYGVNTTTFIWDVSDLSDPQLIGTFVSETSAIDHNMYVLDTLVYQSNYRAGLRVLDLTDIENGELDEVAYFDVYPSSDAAQFNGSWSNYPYLPSGVIPVSHIEEGVFFLKLSDTFVDYGCTDAQACNYDPDATEDDGSCLAFNVCGECEGEDLYCVGCTDETACNYILEATIATDRVFRSMLLRHSRLPRELIP